MLKMMWLASLLIFISIGGCFCDDDDDDERDCFIRNRDKCDEYDLPTEVPQTGEEVLAVCRNVISLGGCLIEASESCSYNPEFFINHVRNAVQYLETTCQEDNPTFKVVTNNLPCIERVFKSRPGSHCSSYFSEKNLEAIRTHINPLIVDKSKEDLAACLTHLLDVTCVGISFGYHCGEEVKDAAEEIQAHIHSPNSLECTPEQLEELSPFMRTFEGLLLEDLALQNALEGKRK